MNACASDLQYKLQASIKRHLDLEVEIHNLRSLSGGASAETRLFDMVIPDAGAIQKVVLRTSSIQQNSQFSGSVSKTCEAQVQQTCAQFGVPVPEILFCLDASDQLGEGYAMTCIEGETIPQKILREPCYQDARGAMTEQCANILGKLHKIPINLLEKNLEDQPALKQLSILENLYRSYQRPSAVFEVAFKWLKKHAPKDSLRALVHGDFRNGNLVVDESGVVGVLDWELCHLGDPVEDLGWLCVNAWCFGKPSPVGGFGELDKLLSYYEAATGTNVSHQQLHYWQMFGTLRWGVICLFQAHCFLSGLNPSIELAAIGRRVSEVEIDLINLLEKA